MSDMRHNVRAEFDAPEFRAAWFSKRPILEIAAEYKTSGFNIWRAARCRGWPPRREINPPKKGRKNAT